MTDRVQEMLDVGRQLHDGQKEFDTNPKPAAPSPGNGGSTQKVEELLQEPVPQKEIRQEQEEVEEDCPRARRLGPYWNTWRYRRVIEFEKDVFNRLRKLVDGGAVTIHELQELLEGPAKTVKRLIAVWNSLGNSEKIDSIEPLHLLAKFVFEAAYSHKPRQVRKWRTKFRTDRSGTPLDDIVKPPNYSQAIVFGFGDEILARARGLVRQGKRFWHDPPYWSNTEWVEPEAEVEPETEPETGEPEEEHDLRF